MPAHTSFGLKDTQTLLSFATAITLPPSQKQANCLDLIIRPQKPENFCDLHQTQRGFYNVIKITFIPGAHHSK